MSSHLDERLPHLSSVEAAVDERTRSVHRLRPMMRDIERFGVSLCGYPAEYLTVLPDVPWSDVARSRRCEHCDADGY